MTGKFQALLLAFPLVSIYSYGQIIGIVTDGTTGKPVRDATVFVNGSSISTLTSKEGSFALDHILVGFCQLIIYKHGYQLFKSSVNVNPGKSFKLNLSLTTENSSDLLKRYFANDQKVEALKKYLFGSNEQLKFSNPKSIRFSGDNEGNNFILIEPLVIENPSLGYNIYCYTPEAEKGASTEQILDNIRFEQMQSQELKVFQVQETNRTESYWGSPRHFIKSLIAGTLSEEGFQAFDLSHNPIEVEASVEKSRMPNYYHIKLPDPIEVIHDQSDQLQKKWMLHPNGRIDATADGQLVSQNSIAIQDEMSNNKIDDLLPMDYDPLPNSSINTVKKFQEKIYVQTDKPYYYNKETIWMKGYVNYEHPQLRDSLSSTVYVEFVNEQNKILFSKAVKIENGAFLTDIWLPDSIPTGDYNIRAYTNFMRNFSSDAIFSKYIPVLSLNEWMDLKSLPPLKSESAGLVITPDKSVYKTRDKITLVIAFSDGTRAGNANVSLAVTDLDQVKPIEYVTILSPSFQIGKKQKFNKEGLKYPLEHGIGIAGQFFNNENKPNKTLLTVIQGKLENMKTVNTDAFGRFFFNGLAFYDEVDCSFQSMDKYGNLFGHVLITPKKPPKVDFFKPASDEALKIEQASHEQRIFSEYELPKSTVLLKEVKVTAKKITDERMEWGRKMYTADRVIYTKNLTMLGNILQTIETKLFGFGIRFDSNTGMYTIYNFRPLPGAPDPVILIDGFPSTLEMLNILPPQNVDRIETSSAAQNIYGVTGNGVIAVYTKNYSNSDTDNKLQVVKISGYSRPTDFRMPDYTLSQTSTSRDLRSTICWNPAISLTSDKGEASVSFFSSDQHGTYRAVVEGMTANEELLRAVAYITVEK